MWEKYSDLFYLVSYVYDLLDLKTGVNIFHYNVKCAFLFSINVNNRLSVQF